MEYMVVNYCNPITYQHNNITKQIISNQPDAPFIALYKKDGNLIGAEVDGCQIMQNGDEISFSKIKSDYKNNEYCATDVKVSRDGNVLKATKRRLENDKFVTRDVTPGQDPKYPTLDTIMGLDYIPHGTITAPSITPTPEICPSVPAPEPVPTNSQGSNHKSSNIDLYV